MVDCIYAGISIINGDTLTTVGDLFAYTMLINMLFNPLRQIADKFNVMQMGIIAADRVFEILEKTKTFKTKEQLKRRILKDSFS